MNTEIDPELKSILNSTKDLPPHMKTPKCCLCVWLYINKFKVFMCGAQGFKFTGEVYNNGICKQIYTDKQICLNSPHIEDFMTNKYQEDEGENEKPRT